MMNILIIEDNEDTQFILSSILNQAGYNSKSINTGEEGLLLFKENSFDIVLLDLVLPGIDGTVVLKELKEIKPDVEVIIITAFPKTDWLINIMRAGVADLLLKPFDKNHLLQIIQRVEKSINLKREVEKRTKELEQANKRLTEIDKMRSNLLSNISHELRTPLTTIIGFSQLIINDPGQSEIAKEQMKLILSESRKLLQIVENLITLSQLELNKVSSSKKNIDINNLIKEILVKKEKEIDKKNLIIGEDLKFDLPFVYGDEKNIEKVLWNIIDNAIKFSKYSGKILIKTYSKDDFNYVDVTDSGPGIHDEDKERIFSRFEQLDPSSTRNYSGLGLGLSLVKELLELENGEIWFNSEINVGTTFTIKLPISPVYISQPVIDNLSSIIDNDVDSDLKEEEKIGKELEKDKAKDFNVIFITKEDLNLTSNGFGLFKSRNFDILNKIDEINPDVVLCDWDNEYLPYVNIIKEKCNNLKKTPILVLLKTYGTSIPDSLPFHIIIEKLEDRKITERKIKDLLDNLRKF